MVARLLFLERQRVLWAEDLLFIKKRQVAAVSIDPRILANCSQPHTLICCPSFEAKQRKKPVSNHTRFVKHPWVWCWKLMWVEIEFFLVLIFTRLFVAWVRFLDISCLIYDFFGSFHPRNDEGVGRFPLVDKLWLGFALWVLFLRGVSWYVETGWW